MKIIQPRMTSSASQQLNQEVYVAAARSTQNFIGIFIGVHREAFQTGFLPCEPPLNTDELSINE